MDYYRENRVDTEQHSERKQSKQLLSNNMSTLGIEAPNWNDCKWKCFFKKSEVATKGAEKMLKEVAGGRWPTVHRQDASPWNKSKGKESCYGMNWLVKSIW